MADEQQLEPRVYIVPDFNYADLQEKVKGLRKRAKRLGITDDIVVTEVGFEDRPIFASNLDGAEWVGKAGQTAPEGSHATGEIRRYHHLTVSGSEVKLPGFEFVGKIEVIKDDEGKTVGNQLRVREGYEVPVVYRSAKPFCEHCGVDRRWNATFIVRHEDGSHQQLGRNCLRDFTGHYTPERLALIAEFSLLRGETLNDAEYDGDEEFSGARRKARYSVETLLLRTAAIIRKDGWRPRKFESNTTVENLQAWCNERGKALEKIELYYPIEECDREVAAKTYEWLESLATQEGLNDYIYNLSLFGQCGSVELRSFGLLASAISAYQRSQNTDEKVKAERAVSQHIGEVGKRLVFTLTVKAVKYIEGDFGTRTLIRFYDEQGNVIVWWASKSINDMAVDQTFEIKATIKKHTNFNEVKQTEISRPTVVREIAEPKTEEVAA